MSFAPPESYWQDVWRLDAELFAAAEARGHVRKHFLYRSVHPADTHNFSGMLQQPDSPDEEFYGLGRWEGIRLLGGRFLLGLVCVNDLKSPDTPSDEYVPTLESRYSYQCKRGGLKPVLHVFHTLDDLAKPGVSAVQQLAEISRHKAHGTMLPEEEDYDRLREILQIAASGERRMDRKPKS